MYREESTTPSDRPLYDTASVARKWVFKVDPNEGRCLVTNVSQSVECCHCIPKKIMKDESIVRVYRIHRYLF